MDTPNHAMSDLLRILERVQSRLDAQEKSLDILTRDVRDALDAFRSQAEAGRSQFADTLRSQIADLSRDFDTAANTVEDRVERLTTSVEAVLLSIEADRRAREVTEARKAQQAEEWKGILQRIFDSKPMQYVIIAVVVLAASRLGISMEALGILPSTTVADIAAEPSPSDE